MSLTGQDLQSTLTILRNDISSNDTIINALQSLTSSHTTDISSNNDDTSEISSNDTDINALQILTTSHTSEINSKQAQITDQIDIKCRDVEADNIILRPPSLFGDIDITKGSISCTAITSGSISAVYSINAGTQLKVANVDVGAKLINLESKISSSTSCISSNSTSISGVAASVAALNSTVYGFGIFPFTTPSLFGFCKTEQTLPKCL